MDFGPHRVTWTFAAASSSSFFPLFSSIRDIAQRDLISHLYFHCLPFFCSKDSRLRQFAEEWERKRFISRFN
jgi:hypothetical protein